MMPYGAFKMNTQKMIYRPRWTHCVLMNLMVGGQSQTGFAVYLATWNSNSKSLWPEKTWGEKEGRSSRRSDYLENNPMVRELLHGKALKAAYDKMDWKMDILNNAVEQSGWFGNFCWRWRIVDIYDASGLPTDEKRYLPPFWGPFLLSWTFKWLAGAIAFLVPICCCWVPLCCCPRRGFVGAVEKDKDEVDGILEQYLQRTEKDLKQYSPYIRVPNLRGIVVELGDSERSEAEHHDSPRATGECHDDRYGDDASIDQQDDGYVADAEDDDARWEKGEEPPQECYSDVEG